MENVLDLFLTFIPEDCELTRKDIEMNLRKSLVMRDVKVLDANIVVVIDELCKMDVETWDSMEKLEQKTQMKFKRCFMNCYTNPTFNLGGLWDALFG